MSEEKIEEDKNMDGIVKSGIPVAEIVESKEWFKQQYRRKSLSIVMLSMVAGLSITSNIMQIYFAPKPVYFALTSDNQLVKLIPLSEPFLSQQDITSWTLSVVGKTMSLNFKDWKIQLTEVQPDFFDTAFSDFVKTMRSSGVIELIETKRLVMNPSAPSSPIISAKGINENGVMSWRVEFPMILSYESSQGTFLTQKFDAVVYIERVSVLDNPKGIKIKQLNLKPK